jgi:uncharacterized membrane protein
MEKLIVVVFDDEAQAYKGLTKLGELHQQADLAVYATSVIAKDTDGKVDIRQAADEGPIGMLLGASMGGLIGLLAGPAGMAVGMASGTLAGSLVDLDRLGIDMQFLDDVASIMTSGKVALVASVDEGWTTPLDTAMEAEGGTVFRKLRSEVIEDQFDRAIRETEAELESLNAELEAASAEQEAKIQAKIDATNKKLDDQMQAAEKWMQETSERTDAKIKALQEQAAAASEKKKAKLEKRIAEIQEDSVKRTEKLKEAAAIAKEALTL